MSNSLNGNTFYIDSQYSSAEDDLVRKQVLVVYVLLTATSSNARIVLADVGPNPTTKLDLRIDANNSSQCFSFETNPILFPNGIRVTTLSNAVATLSVKSPGG